MTRKKSVSGCVLMMAAAFFGWPGRGYQDGRPIEKHWWEKEPLRIIDLVTSTGQIAALGPAEMAREKAAQRYNAEHLEVMDMKGGLDDQFFYFSSSLASKKNRDFLKEYLPEAKKNGLRVFIYFNVHWYKQDFAKLHPDWVQIKENGRPLDGVYETGTSFCVNSPYREWCFQILRDLCAYGIDGIFYDGPIFFPETCYCPYCREKFESRRGHPLPSKKERRGEIARELLEFQAGSLADYLRDSRAVIKSINPEIAFYMNGGERGGNWSTGRLNRVLVKEQDILGSEGGFIGGDLLRTPIWKPGVTARFLETQAGGKPRVIFSAAGHKPWTFSLLPAPELRLLYSQTIANGANVWLGLWPSEFDPSETKPLIDMNRFVSENAAFLMGTRSEARTAIVWSDDTANFYRGSEGPLIKPRNAPEETDVGDFGQEFSGIAEALIRSRTPFDIIDDISLENEDLSRYALIILPNTACLSDQAAARIREYVKNGGNLFATFESSLYDRNGIRHDDFALADIFGVRAGNGVVGPKRWDFMRRFDKTAFLEGLDRESIPATTFHVPVRLEGGREFLRFTEPLAGPYEKVPELSNDPALVVNKAGKGTAAYFSGDLGGSLQRFHLAEDFRIVANAVTELSPKLVVIESAPAYLDVVLRSQADGNRLLLHLVNFTGEMTRPITKIIPLENIRITFPGLTGAKDAYTLVRPQKLATQRDRNGKLQLTLPRLEEYEVVVIEK